MIHYIIKVELKDGRIADIYKCLEAPPSLNDVVDICWEKGIHAWDISGYYTVWHENNIVLKLYSMARK